MEREIQIEAFISEEIEETEGSDSNFVKVFKLMSRKVVKDLNGNRINGAGDTLWWMIEQIRLGQHIVYAHPRFIARDIGKSISQVYKHLKLLEENGYIKRTEQPHLVKINPRFMFKGTAKRCQLEDF